VRLQLRLNLLRALDSVNHGREVRQKSIADRLNDRPVMFRHRLVNELIMDLQQP
jgi:hypothetical protein